MKILYGMLLKLLIPVFLIFLLFFVLVFEMIDLFTYLWRYIKEEVPLADIFYILYQYIPKCISYSIPVAWLFSISFTLGLLYTNKEMFSVFSSGITLYRFVIPLILIGLFLSICGFFFDELVVIDTLKVKNDFQNQVLNRIEDYSESNVTIISKDNLIIYHADIYDDNRTVLTGITFIERDNDNNLLFRYDASYAEWNGQNWVLHDCFIYTYLNDTIDNQWQQTFSSEKFNEEPVMFRKITRNIEEMSFIDAYGYIESLKKAGLDYSESLSEFYKKFAFAFVPLLVALISSAIGSFFNHNIVMISLLFSLGIVIGYYVSQLVTMSLARNGYILPFIGAFSPIFIFLLIGLGLLRYART